MQFFQQQSLPDRFQGIDAPAGKNTRDRIVLTLRRSHPAEKAFLLEDSKGWMRFYQGTPSSKRWGTTEDQHMLSTVVDKSTGAPARTIRSVRGNGRNRLP